MIKPWLNMIQLNLVDKHNGSTFWLNLIDKPNG
jgi:hypothetical protein